MKRNHTSGSSGLVALMKLLAIPLGRQKTATKWLVIGYQNTIAKSLVMMKLLAGAALFGLVSQSALAVQQGTASGTTISNTATVNHSVGGLAQPAIGSSPTGNTSGAGTATTFLVDKKVNVLVTATDVAAVSVVPGEAGAVTTFSVTNLGNDPQDFALAAADVASGQTLFGKTDNFVATGILVFVENGLAAGYQSSGPNQDTATHIDALASGDSKIVYVVVSIPATQANNDAALVSLVATARIDDGAATLGGALTDTSGSPDNLNVVQTVFADGTGSDDAAAPAHDAAYSARDAYLVTSAVLTVTKTVSVLCDPFNGISNPKNIPGAIVQYTILVSNAGGAGASSTLTTAADTLDTHVIHDPGLRAPTDAATCIAGTGTGGFKIVSTTPNTRGVGGTAGVMTNALADNDGASISGQNVTIDYTYALPAGTFNSVVYTAGELKPGESATITYNAIIN